MNPIKKYHYEKDRAEAQAIARQLSYAPPGAEARHVADLNRFCECCDDGEGYDVPRERIRELKSLGLLEGGRGGWCTLTPAGQRVRDAWFDAVDEISSEHE